MPVVATKAITTFHLNRLGSRIKYKISNEAKEMIDELSYEFVNSVVVQASLNSGDAAQITEKNIADAIAQLEYDKILNSPKSVHQ